MSVAVALDELGRRFDEFGPRCYLVTTSREAAAAHVVSVLAAFDGHRFALPAGGTSRGNVGASGRATLLWPAGDGPYSLIVDGDAHHDDEAVYVDPTRAVLHRVAGAPDDLPTCVRIEPDD